MPKKAGGWFIVNDLRRRAMGGFFHDVSNGLEKEVTTVYVLSFFTNLDPRIYAFLLRKVGKVFRNF